MRICMRVCAYKYTRMCVYVYAHVRICIRVCAYVYMHMCVSVSACVRIKMHRNTHTHIHVCSLVFMSWLTVFLLLAALECVQKNLILVHRISAESTKKPICEQRSEYAPSQDVSFICLHHR